MIVVSRIYFLKTSNEVSNLNMIDFQSASYAPRLDFHVQL